MRVSLCVSLCAGVATHRRGNYADSLACCEKAQNLLVTPSHLAHGCQGLAHQYMHSGEGRTGEHLDAAVRHFSAADQLLADDLYEVVSLHIHLHYPSFLCSDLASV